MPHLPDGGQGKEGSVRLSGVVICWGRRGDGTCMIGTSGNAYGSLGKADCLQLGLMLPLIVMTTGH